ncbi:hypothetical protein ACP4OV_020758 [Aristida adscensionis]
MMTRRLSVLVLTVTVLLLLLGTVSSLLVHRRYDAIFSFGDSFTDTGDNLAVLAALSLPNPAAGPPYGITFFGGNPTGHNSDGRLIIDFIAEELGLPLVPPFLAHNVSFRRGANFAVAVATAIDAGRRGMPRRQLLSSQHQLQRAAAVVRVAQTVTVQLQPCPQCKSFFKNSLFFMGEFGVNDYGFSAIIGKSLPHIRSLVVPKVIRTISAATERIVKAGAKTVVVPGVPPLGCAPSNLMQFPSVDPEDYDSRTGCLKQFDDLAMHHNSLLHKAIKTIRRKHHNVRVIYVDFFTPIIRMIESPHKVYQRYSEMLLRWRR